MKKLAPFILLMLSSVSLAELNKTYPTAATTQIRFDAYMDAITTIYNSTYSVSYSTHEWDTTSMHIINEIVDKDMEQYLVYPASFTMEPWKGWCMKTVNGNIVPIACSN